LNSTLALDLKERFSSSFVQTRGSIPVCWEQKANLQYKPNHVLLNKEHENTLMARRHFEEQLKLYGSQVIVNLIDQKGPELVLADAYEALIRKLDSPKLKYVSFDFHHYPENKCSKKMRILFELIQSEFQKHSYFLLEHPNNILSFQTGVIRSNCVDNLDRTNVVQSYFARQSLQEQLIRLGILQYGQSIADHPQFEIIFRNVWISNGDALSIQYAGTPSLKSDFTRTGARTFQGLLQDGYYAMRRYYLNNFCDGFRQDCYDLFLGNYIVNPYSPSPFTAATTMRILVFF